MVSKLNEDWSNTTNRMVNHATMQVGPIESISQNEPLYCVKGYKARSAGMHAQARVVHMLKNF